jgi:dipeptidyl-peptidase-4
MAASHGWLTAAGLVAACFATVTMADELTLERLYAAPDLNGPTLRGLRFSPDSERVTFLRGAADDKDRFDLWEFDLKERRARLLVDSRSLVPKEEKLSAEEEARRERQRTASLRGIVDYEFAADGRALLFPLNGDLYRYDLSAPAAQAVRRITETPAAETDPKFSPRGRYVSYVREQDLYAFDLQAGAERRLTTDGGGLVSNGMAEFIAQEEMDRDTGYWWSPDEQRIAYARVDEAPVAEVERFEIYADDVKVVKQRYPKAGAANALVELYVQDVTSGERRKIDLANAVPGLAPTTDYYLARVDWFPDGRRLLVQRQTRDQKRLDLLEVDAATGATRVLATETAEQWVELHNDLRFLKKRGGFLWVSQRSGYPHVYRYDEQGRLVAQLTGGDWLVAGAPQAIAGVDEERGLVYFTGTKDGYVEKNLYSVPLDAKAPAEPVRLTAEAGWHDVQMSRDARTFIDTHSNVDRPPNVSLKDAKGRRVAWLVENPLDAKHPYAPYVAEHPRFEFGTVPAADGTPLHWVLMKPHDFDPSKKYPVVVHVYGGPHAQYVANQWPAGIVTQFRNYLVRQGFLVFAIDNRGAGRQGVKADVALHRNMGAVEVEDQVAGVNWLKTQPFVDGERIGVFGWSYGGYMALNMLMRSPGTYAAGVSGAPVTDWSLYDTHYTERYMGTPQDNPSGYAAGSVLTHAKNLADPLLVIHGMADDNVLFAHATKLFAELQKLGKPFDVMVYPGYKHGLLRDPVVGLHAHRAIAEYLDRHLKSNGSEPKGSDPIE